MVRRQACDSSNRKHHYDQGSVNAARQHVHVFLDFFLAFGTSFNSTPTKEPAHRALMGVAALACDQWRSCDPVETRCCASQKEKEKENLGAGIPNEFTLLDVTYEEPGDTRGSNPLNPLPVRVVLASPLLFISLEAAPTRGSLGEVTARNTSCSGLPLAPPSTF